MPDPSTTIARSLTDVLFDAPGTAHCLVAPDGTIVRANGEWLRSTGFSAAQVTGEDIVALFPGTRDMALAMHARARAGHRVEVPRHAQLVNGRETWWEGSIVPVEMEGGTGLLITAREVSNGAGQRAAGSDDRTRSERTLTEEKEKYRALFQLSTDAVYLTLADGTILDANPAACRLHGMTLDEIKRAGRAGLVVQDERHAAALTRRAATGHVRAEFTDCRKDGTTFPVEVESVILDPSRADSPAFVIARDITERRRAEEALRASEERFRSVFECAAVGIARVGLDGRFLEVNDAYGAIVGYTPDELLRLDFHAVTHPDDRDADIALLGRLVAGELPSYHGLKRYLRKGGEVVWVSLSVGLARDREGRPAYCSVVVEDVTERRRAAAAAARSEAVLAHSGAMAHLGAWWIDVTEDADLNANPLRWSDEVFRIFGYAPGEVEVSNALFFRHVHPDDRARVADAVAQALASRTRYTVEHRIVRRDGAERIVLERGEARYDAGRLVQIIGAVQDVTEQKRTEEDLRRALERHARQVRLFDGVASTTPDFVYLFDREGRFLYANRRLLEVWGMRLPDIVGKTCRELGYEQWHHDMHMREIAQVIATRQPIKGEVAFEAPLTGIYGVYEYIFTPVLGTDGEVEVIAGTTRDITERKHAQEALVAANEKLREADRRKDEFLGMLSHELRNPLAPIRNSIYLLQHASPGSERARRAQDVIVRQTEHLTRLVDDLLDITRIARGKIELRRSHVDLREVVSRAADDFRVLLHDRGVRFEVVLPDGRLWADADATRVTQVVGNLLHNASKFTRRGDAVTLSLDAVQGSARIRVRDTGAGIDPELLGRVFDPFVQGERTLARTNGGLGLGLALVKGITELHGGDARVRSAGQGQGSEFVVELPLLAAVEAEPAPAVCLDRRVRGPA